MNPSPSTPKPKFWYFTVLKRFAKFRGRATRKEFWHFALVDISILIALILGAVYSKDFSTELSAWINVVMEVYLFGLWIPRLAVAVRRLHDIGYSGFWILVPLAPWMFFCLMSDPNVNRYGIPDHGFKNK